MVEDLPVDAICFLHFLRGEPTDQDESGMYKYLVEHNLQHKVIYSHYQAYNKEDHEKRQRSPQKGPSPNPTPLKKPRLLPGDFCESESDLVYVEEIAEESAATKRGIGAPKEEEEMKETENIYIEEEENKIKPKEEGKEEKEKEEEEAEEQKKFQGEEEKEEMAEKGEEEEKAESEGIKTEGEEEKEEENEEEENEEKEEERIDLCGQTNIPHQPLRTAREEEQVEAYFRGYKDVEEFVEDEDDANYSVWFSDSVSLETFDDDVDDYNRRNGDKLY